MGGWTSPYGNVHSKTIWSNEQCLNYALEKEKPNEMKIQSGVEFKKGWSLFIVTSFVSLYKKLIGSRLERSLSLGRLMIN